jgi:hypothetical protein
MNVFYQIFSILLLIYGAHMLAEYFHNQGCSWKQVYLRGVIGSVIFAALAFVLYGQPSCLEYDDPGPHGTCIEYADDGKPFVYESASGSAVSMFFRTFLAGNVAFQILRRKTDKTPTA